MKYIISTTADYADEFDYGVCSIFTEEQKQQALTIVNSYEQYGYKEEFYFGTNEALEFNKDDIIAMINNAQQITPEEEVIFLKFYHGADLDIIKDILG